MGKRSLLEIMAESGIKSSRILRPLKMEADRKYKGRHAYRDGPAEIYDAREPEPQAYAHNGRPNKENLADFVLPSETGEIQSIPPQNVYPFIVVDIGGETKLVDPILNGNFTVVLCGDSAGLFFGVPIDKYNLGKNQVLETIITEHVRSVGGIYAGKPLILDKKIN